MDIYCDSALYSIQYTESINYKIDKLIDGQAVGDILILITLYCLISYFSKTQQTTIL